MIPQKNSGPAGFWHRVQFHGGVMILALMGAFALFTNLDGEFLWADEGDTAVLAVNILEHGVPKAWDGVTFTDSDYGERVNKDLVMISHPWLQYYVTAASFWFFGETTFAARFPFAFCGWLTIILTYLLTWKTTHSRKAALAAALLLLLSVQFLVFSRQCRNYSLNALLTLLLILQFYRLNSWRNTLLFALLGILLFHAHPIGFAPLVALGILVFAHRVFTPLRKWFGISAALIGVFTIPWLFLARRGYEHNTTLLEKGSVFFPRLLQFLIECASVTPLLGILLLLGALHFRHRRATHKRKTLAAALGEPERTLGLVLGLITVIYAVVMALTQSRDMLWLTGVRHTSAIIPFTMIAAGILITRWAAHWRSWFILLLVFGFTKMARITPWTFWDEQLVQRNPQELAACHVPPKVEDRLFRTGQIGYLKSLFHDNPGTVARVCEFLKNNARPDDILITNYEWEPLYFHTRLPQGMKILPQYPIYSEARAQGLPDYVFEPEGVRWIVWRPLWGPYRGHEYTEILKTLEKDGARVEQVAALPETSWENRENIHFRRFPGNDYNYPWPTNFPDALIFRVDWPTAGMTEKTRGS